MAVLGAARAFKDWQVANGLASTETSEGDPDERDGEPGADISASSSKLSHQEEAQDISDSALQAMEEEDPLSLIDSLNTRVSHPVVPSVTSSKCLS